MHAFEVGRQLIELGETVKTLIMIDAPCPKALPHMPDPTLELMEQTGIFIGIKRAGKPDKPMALSTKQHLVSCVKALKVYNPIPIPPGRYPENVFLIWAKDGTFEKMSDTVADLAAAEEEGAKNNQDTGLRKDWLTATRKSFGPNGWDRLVGNVGNIECVAISGDHFSIMNLPMVMPSPLLPKPLYTHPPPLQSSGAASAFFRGLVQNSNEDSCVIDQTYWRINQDISGQGWSFLDLGD